ncbi:hypothetical protein Ddye_029629 [Dipteronia dyeriana]|uniref:Uncharacterized protein n=1 Tax=Dipteronia dyeriana TaxID=168575 RepID=A0AAD9TEX2_9ROSI|nr:hypothetical protein Ddye_029629 [Dipteronia dyeriana]
MSSNPPYAIFFRFRRCQSPSLHSPKPLIPTPSAAFGTAIEELHRHQRSRPDAAGSYPGGIPVSHLPLPPRER